MSQAAIISASLLGFQKGKNKQAFLDLLLENHIDHLTPRFTQAILKGEE